MLAGRQNAQASRNFSDSARSINSGIIDAVDRLNLQAANTQILAQEAAAQTEIARQGLHIGNDPILVAPSEPQRTLRQVSDRYGDYFETSCEYRNIGKTPAISIVVTKMIVTTQPADIAASTMFPPIPFYDGLSGDVIAAGDQKQVTVSQPGKYGELHQLQGIGSERNGFSILGYIRYKDLFEKKHITAFCNFYPFTPGTGNTPRQCKGGNWFEHSKDTASLVTSSQR